MRPLQVYLKKNSLRIPISKDLLPSCKKSGSIYKRVSLDHLQPDVALTDTSKAGLPDCLNHVYALGKTGSPKFIGRHNILVHPEGHRPTVTLSPRSREHTGWPDEQHSSRSEGIVTVSSEIRVYSKIWGISNIDLFASRQDGKLPNGNRLQHWHVNHVVASNHVVYIPPKVVIPLVLHEQTSDFLCECDNAIREKEIGTHLWWTSLIHQLFYQTRAIFHRK